MKFRIVLAALLVLLTFTGCSATVKGSVIDPMSGTNAADAPSTSAADVANDGALIGEERAKTIALEQAGLSEGDVTRLRVEYEIDNGVKQYDVEFRHGGYEYEYEINAQTGAVISFDRDTED